VERLDGIQATGNFVLHVSASPNPNAPGQNGGNSGGGGCNAGIGAFTALFLTAFLWIMRKN